ncbi:MAG: KUP/HAK/KT family potassium transporter [Bacteroidota bacterium]
MQNGTHHTHLNKVTAAGLLVTLGIIFGDIGTSPLYVLKAIVGDAPIDGDTVLGGLSCIFWTLTMQTTLKYVVLTLRADNKGEGGIFSLYTLVRRTRVKWLIFPAIIGGATLIADGVITPTISVSSAIEGLRATDYFHDIPTSTIVIIVIAILTLLFLIQQFGTKTVGGMFGPIMLVWFMMLGTVGLYGLSGNLSVFKAINPYYAWDILSHHPEGLLILGAVFLCTTGAEALYSDLGHCGRKNIRIAWIFVKIMLLVNYFGQGAWLMNHEGKYLSEIQGGNPFYSMMPEWFLYIGIGIATAATIIASQALISASFTLINEAMRLNLWPKVTIKYPTEMRGQLYIPSINWLLWAGCVAIMIGLRESSNMEAAYGLTINIDMLMTTILLTYFLVLKRYNPLFIFGFLIVYMFIEGSFLMANLSKIWHGGWITILLASVLVSVMLVWNYAKKIRARYVEFVKLDDYRDMIVDLSKDLSIPKYSTHLVYLTQASQPDEIEAKIIYSILQKQPKRADIYWFIHVDVVDEPYRMEYKVIEKVHNDIIRVDFRLGFRVAPRINLMFRKVVQDMVRNHEVDITSRYESLNKNNIIGDFRFVVIEKFLALENDLPWYEKIILDIYFILRRLSLPEARAFGLDTSSLTIEKFPLIVAPIKDINLKRIVPDQPKKTE